MLSRFYFSKVRAGVSYIYGPFATQQDAARAGYLHRSVELRDEAAKNSHICSYVREGVAAYTDAEVSYLQQNAEEEGYRAVVVRSGSKLSRHRSWSSITSRDILFADDFRRY